MDVANLLKLSSAPPFRSDKVVLYAATDGYVYQRGTDGTFQLARQSEVTTALTAGLATKAALVHTHIIADTTGLQAALDAKEAVDAQRVQIGTPVASTSGTSIDFTGIPSGTRKINVSFSGVSTNGSSVLIIQLGTASGVETTAYVAVATYLQNATALTVVNSTQGFVLTGAMGAAEVLHGTAVLTLVSSSTNTWSCIGGFSDTASTVNANTNSGGKSLAATLDRVRVTTNNGTDAFDAGTINIAYER